jgi:iron complex transport system permease protein
VGASLLLLLMSIFLLSLAIGSVSIPLDEIVRVLTGGEASRPAWTNIILKFRLPKALTAIFAGAALSVSGLLMQTFFRNPLADPFTLGISSGASLGVALVVLSAGTIGGAVLAGLGLLGDFGLAAAASVGAGLTMILVLMVARRITSSTTLLILGLMFGYATGAVVSFLMYFSIPERLQAFTNWGAGTFSGVTWNQMVILLPAVSGGLILAVMLAKSLNALLPGETYARSMGLNLARTRLGIIIAAGLLAGTVTAFCGPIGFLGVAVPHLCRIVFKTADHRLLLPAAMLLGAIAALLAALIAEVPGSELVLPLNAVTAFFGAPVVMAILLRGRQPG